MHRLVNNNGITVKQLREFLQDIPDTEDAFGEENSVWVLDSNGLSNQVEELWTGSHQDVFLTVRCPFSKCSQHVKKEKTMQNIEGVTGG